MVTEVVSATEDGAIPIALPALGESSTGETYYIRPMKIEGESERRDGNPRWMLHQFNLFPIVLDAAGIPWAEANIWILTSAEGTVVPAMASYASTAEDLAAYRRFLDETGIDWLNFPSHKLQRPTYRYNGHLRHIVANSEIAATTAKRRMATVIRFYRWLQEEKVFIPEHDPWKASDRYIEFKGTYGFSITKKVMTTDISIKSAKQDDPYDGCIDDGGKLRPLSTEEQEWLLDALLSCGNTEMTLIHLFGLVTGARIQTILTFRVRHVLEETNLEQHDVLRFPVGPGTGIDTKFDKQLVLHIPVWFYQMLRTYAFSNRSRDRRVRAMGGDNENQYLFLSIRGAPLYSAKEDLQAFDEVNLLRHAKAGQGVRQFITERVIPFVQRKYHAKNFHYQFHDTRATFGMNLTDHQLKLVEEGKTSLKEVMNFVKTRMGHASSATTERYLQYRSRLKMVRVAQDGWELHLEQLAKKILGKIDD